ncbi:hypothetical protein [Streptomyces griseiscabiei]|uniref:Integral membrane protein n=1 Tax=Streptomyces griseiscabiei TaxID=2993540 RepID=A0ABU4L598_9ACTN|nr:hypothetical protein [Streptomyces griseiscabiei]MBZ3901923.1 hypothetical protein [Streptomyces griseiscabiei]MDX2910877.1 hypothetical protein [Streptomyces griseiscabiei]
MNGRVLRIELRRSVAPWAGAATLVLALAFLYLLSDPWWKGAAPWTSQWTSMALWTRFLLAFVWPLALALGALQGLRDHRSGISELLTTTPRPARHRAATSAGATAITLTSAFALVVLTGAVQVTGAEYTHLGWLPISLVGALALPAGALLGMGIARHLPSPLTPPALAVAAFVFVNLLRMSTDSGLPTAVAAPTRVALLSPMTAEVRNVFLTLSAPVHLGQTVWLLGMAVTGLALLAAATPRARLLALAPVLAGAVLALFLLPADPRRAYVVDEAAAAQVCDGPVCVSAAHRERLADLTGPGKKTLGLLRNALGAEAPTTVRENTALRAVLAPPKRSRTAVLVDFDDDVFADARGERLTRALLGQGLVPVCSARSAQESGTLGELAAQGVVAGWVLGDLRPIEGSLHATGDQLDMARPVLEELKALPWSEQVARVRKAHTASVACSGDPLDILDGGTAR